MSADDPTDWLASLPELLTADEVAKLLRTTRKAIYAKIERGQLPFFRVGPKSVRFRRDEIRRWLAERYVPTRDGRQ